MKETFAGFCHITGNQDHAVAKNALYLLKSGGHDGGRYEEDDGIRLESERTKEGQTGKTPYG